MIVVATRSPLFDLSSKFHVQIGSKCFYQNEMSRYLAEIMSAQNYLQSAYELPHFPVFFHISLLLNYSQ